MNFALDENQTALKSAVESYLADAWTMDRLREGREGRARFWQDFHANIGIAAVNVPEAAGGLGGGRVETMLVMEALGAALAGEAYLPSCVMAGSVLAASHSPLAPPLLTEIADTGAIVAWAHGESGYGDLSETPQTTARRDGAGYILTGLKRLALLAPMAGHAVVSAKVEGEPAFGLFLLPLNVSGLSQTERRLIDAQAVADLRLDGVRLPANARLDRPGEGPALVDLAIHRAILALGAEAVGITGALIEQTAEYLKQRQQFGQPLAAFQALQHRMAEMLVEHEHLRSMVYMATLTPEEPRDSLAKACSALKVQMGQALRYVSENAVQLHGGMGITDELKIGHYMKRAQVIMAQFGSAGDHLKRYDTLRRAA